MHSTVRLAAALAPIAFLLGCAGPTTPLGAPWIVTKDDAAARPIGELAENPPRYVGAKPQISFFPPRQVLHEPTPTEIRVFDPDGIKADHRIVIRHNGLDVTASFLRQAKVIKSSDGRTLTMSIPSTRFAPSKDHVIEVAYQLSNAELLAYAWYEPPECRAFDQKLVATTGDFTVDPSLVDLIENISTQKGFNPVLIAALIAQESGFNPRTVSWAKALGLTQITPVADRDLAQKFNDWPRYPEVHRISFPRLKLLVMSGKVNERNDWRLNSERSILGGLAYLELLNQWWSSDENQRKIEWIVQHQLRVGNPTPTEDAISEETTKLLLASYNSGFTRVQSAMNRMGPGWMKSRDLREARRYVNRIFSLCDSFAADPTSVPEQEELVATE